MLPEGYTVQKETVQISNFLIPKSFQISESQKISLEIIDLMFFNSRLKMHILPEHVEMKTILSVKPKFLVGKI